MKRINRSVKKFNNNCLLNLEGLNVDKMLDYLIDLGYDDCYRYTITSSELKTHLWTTTFGCCGLTGFVLDFMKRPNDEEALDLGSNLNLFLAITALNDENDYMQWFTNGEDWYQHKDRNKFDTSSGLWRKVSLDELFTNFDKLIP